MSQKTKRSFKAYSAWNYDKEIEDLNAASAQGWQLARGGCFHSRFIWNPNIRYRYQLDFGKIEDMGRYIELFREQGWEYINSTFNGWHYFRKLYDPSLPEEEYEIFTDRESLHEMNGRWARMALLFCALLGVLTVTNTVRFIRRPSLPVLVQVLTFGIECAFLLRGWLIMRNPETGRSRRADNHLLAVFFAVILLGSAASLILMTLRPDFSTEQNQDAGSKPVRDNRWIDFTVRYPDNYYLDLNIQAEEPLHFSVINEDDEPVYEVTETAFQEENIRLKLAKGHYWFSMSCDGGFSLRGELD